MEQTTVSQYFTARKHSSSFQPSKRRKIDVDSDIVGKIASKRTSKLMENRSKHAPTSIKNKKINEKPTVTQLLIASPLVIDNEIIQTRDDHDVISPKRKVPRKTTPEPTNKNPSKSMMMFSRLSSEVEECERKVGQVPVKPEINEQAKALIYSRGKALANAGLLNKNKQMKSPSKASDVLQAISPQKGRQTEGLLERRGRMRNKYAHLLQADASLPSSPRAEESTSTNLNLSNSSTKTLPERPYQKYKYLADKAVPSTFPLPSKYKMLLEMFRCADSVLFLLNQRSEICTYERLKKSVQTMCGKDFTMNHLAAMKTVYSNGFIFRQEKHLHSSGSKTSAYQLTVEANYKDCLLTNKGKLTSSILITRKLKFETNILEITKAIHQKFLRKLNIRLDNKDIHRWHPNFKVDEVADIPLASLPQAPVAKCVSTASDLLQKTGNNFVMKVEKALENVAKTSEDQLNVNDHQTTDNHKNRTKTSNSKLKGVSISILERIREKEKKKMELVMTRDPKQETRISQMARLPEMSRILKTYFTAERKAVITMEDCVQKLSESYGSSLQHDKIEQHVRLLSELVPSWLSIVLVRKCSFVKLVRSYDINSVLNSLSNIRREEEMK